MVVLCAEKAEPVTINRDVGFAGPDQAHGLLAASSLWQQLVYVGTVAACIQATRVCALCSACRCGALVLFKTTSRTGQQIWGAGVGEEGAPLTSGSSWLFLRCWW